MNNCLDDWLSFLHKNANLTNLFIIVIKKQLKTSILFDMKNSAYICHQLKVCPIQKKVGNEVSHECFLLQTPLRWFAIQESNTSGIQTINLLVKWDCQHIKLLQRKSVHFSELGSRLGKCPQVRVPPHFLTNQIWDYWLLRYFLFCSNWTVKDIGQIFGLAIFCWEKGLNFYFAFVPILTNLLPLGHPNPFFVPI